MLFLVFHFSLKFYLLRDNKCERKLCTDFLSQRQNDEAISFPVDFHIGVLFSFFFNPGIVVLFHCCCFVKHKAIYFLLIVSFLLWNLLVCHINGFIDGCCWINFHRHIKLKWLICEAISIILYFNRDQNN